MCVKLVIGIGTPSFSNQSVEKICKDHYTKTGKNYFSQKRFVTERESVEGEKRIYDSHVPLGALPNFEVIHGNYITSMKGPPGDWKYAMDAYQPEQFDFMVFLGIAGMQPASGNPDWAVKKYKKLRECPYCRNKLINIELPGDFQYAKLPKKQNLFHFTPPHLDFAKEKFVRAYKKSKLTGLSFTEVEKGLFHVSAVLHRWNDRSGVCCECETKTNVVSCSFFNLPEKYNYDFQRVAINTCSGYKNDPIYVISPAAFRFLRWLQMRFCLIPIMPGYMADLVWPAPRMFTNGTYPTTVYREK